MTLYFFQKNPSIYKFVNSKKNTYGWKKKKFRIPSPRIRRQVGQGQISRSWYFFEARYPAAGRAAKLRLLNFLSLFRDLQKPTRFSGGGVVAGFFRDLQEPSWFSGGGVAGFFRDLQLRNKVFTQHYVMFVGRDTHFA